jgi:hypothetical protein
VRPTISILISCPERRSRTGTDRILGLDAIGKLRVGIDDVRSMVTDLSDSAAEIRRASLGARLAAE